MKRSRTKAEKVYVIIYSWLPITRTRANSNLARAKSNQSRFPLDFFLKFTVILPSFTVELSITRTSRQLEVIFVSLQNISTQFYPGQLEPCYKRVTSREKNRVLKSETLNTIESISSLLFFVTPVQIHCPSLYTLLLNCVPPPHPFVYFLTYFRLFASNSR